MTGRKQHPAGRAQAVPVDPIAGPALRGQQPEYDSAGLFVQLALDHVLGRGAAAHDIEQGRLAVESGGPALDAWLRGLLETAAHQRAAHSAAAAPELEDGAGCPCWIMGTQRHLGREEWDARLRAAQAEGRAATPPLPNGYPVMAGARPLVTALASVYRAGPFIADFMANITGQDSFDDCCELLIIDANSPDNEYATIAPYLNRHRNIRYVRCHSRLSIYEAWNLAVRQARGSYLTSTNVDDVRRQDSLMLQAGVLDNLPFIDVVYQDFYYTLDPHLSFEQIAAVGVQSQLPAVTPHIELQFNPPHHAPMWRRRLHEEIGLFDTGYQSAGDYEFWLRCLAAGKRFFKCNDPHAAYFHNPRGLSTRSGTLGHAEARRATRTHGRALVPAEIVMSRQHFLAQLQALQAAAVDSGQGDRYRLTFEALQAAARHSKFTDPSAHA